MRIKGIRGSLSALVVITACMTSLAAGVAYADSPTWEITSASGPTNFAAGDVGDQYTLTATNVGGAGTDGSPITVSDILPSGVTVEEITGTDTASLGGDELECEETSLSCKTNQAVDVGQSVIVRIHVAVSGTPPQTLVNHASVSGGGASEASTDNPTTVSATPVGFGLASGSVFATRSTGQAGAHPNLTTAFSFNESAVNVPSGSPKDVTVALPPGLVGNPTATPRCTINAVLHNSCPEDTMVGLASVTLLGFLPAGGLPVYNIVPYHNEPAAFAFNAFLFPVRLDTSVRSDGDYGVNVSISDLSEASTFTSSAVTFWGVPGEHNGAGPFRNALGQEYGGPGSSRVPLLSNPTVCGAPSSVELSLDPWAEPGMFTPPYLAPLSVLTGCDALSFTPSITVRPDTLQAGAPAGYDITMRVPQATDATALATPELRDAIVTLPQGTVVSPSAANGLEGCGYTPGVEPVAGNNQIGLHSTRPASCTPASRIGTVEIHTPLLESPLEGSVYLAKQTENPFSSLMAIYIVAEGSGVVVKLAGRVTLDESSGQLTTTFSENPQLPFDELKIHLNGGAGAPLANPTECGAATAHAVLTPYGGGAAAELASGFVVGGCQNPQPFAPSLSAGMTSSAQAGAFSPFSVTLARDDAQQDFGMVSIQTPPGLLGMLSRVTLCQEPQAASGACGPDSMIGHVTVGAGPGPTPFHLGGQVFLTGPYDGAPFGLSIVVPVKAGPYDLGPEVVRAAIQVDPRTSQLTITTAALPTSKDGIPFEIRTINVLVDRAGFMFNPTNCDAMTIDGHLTSTHGTSAALASPFQVANCALLPFQPKFSVSTQARTSRAGGASLHVTVTSGAGQANIGKVAVSLPKKLPSRLTTIQKACPEATFDGNPSSCPAGANVGTGTAVTPVLGQPLTGPAYLVSHGGAAFPDLVVVLQGEGVTVDLVGAINISKAGITSSAFTNVPDVPITRFDLTLPEGAHSALTATLPAKARGSLCASSLVMPTTITGQNGAQIKQSTKISVTGCPRRKAKPKHTAKRKTKR